MNTILLIIIIVLLIVLIYYLYRNSPNITRKRVNRLLNKSAGIFDRPARQAMAEINRIARPAANDYFNRARIIEHNILGGQEELAIGDQRQLINQVIIDYQMTIDQMRAVMNDTLFADNTDFMVAHIGNFGDNIGIAFMGLSNAREELTENRVARAQQEATPAAAVDKYFDISAKFTSDPQNVHESKVGESLAATAEMIKPTAESISQSSKSVSKTAAFEEIKSFINNKYEDDLLTPAEITAKKQNALRVLAEMQKGGHISKYNDTEDNILANVWARAKVPENALNSAKIQEAVVNALADGIENNSVVCINGRAGRVLGSLATLDANPKAGQAITYEAFRNQIFEESRKIISDQVERAKNSPDDDIKNVGKSYDNPSIEVNPITEQFFKDDLKKLITNNLETYKEKLTEKELMNIKKDCLAAVDI